MSALWAVLMAGGSGTRFWPASRRARPKQLLPIAGDRSLLARTSARLGDLVPPERQLVVTSAALVGEVAELLPRVPPAQILGEPVPRNTGPCIGLAARIVAHLDREATVAALPTDHAVRDERAFREHLAAATQVVAEHPRSVLVFGVPPDRPAEGFGYLEQGERIGTWDGHDAHRLLGFVEKPDRARAEELLAKGDCAWNAGIFVFRPAALAAAYDHYLPEAGPTLETLARAWEHDGRTSAIQFEQTLAEEFPLLAAVSIDQGLMERLAADGGVLGMPLRVGWDDVGSWSALGRLLPPDAAGNVVQGQALAQRTRDCVLAAPDGGLVAVRGVDGLIIVHTPDATLVCRKDDDQGVRALVAELEKRGLDGYL